MDSAVYLRAHSPPNWAPCILPPLPLLSQKLPVPNNGRSIKGSGTQTIAMFFYERSYNGTISTFSHLIKFQKLFQTHLKSHSRLFFVRHSFSAHFMAVVKVEILTQNFEQQNNWFFCLFVLM